MRPLKDARVDGKIDGAGGSLARAAQWRPKTLRVSGREDAASLSTLFDDLFSFGSIAKR